MERGGMREKERETRTAYKKRMKEREEEKEKYTCFFCYNDLQKYRRSGNLRRKKNFGDHY